ncbi:MAG: M15 family metallopeptidase [Burkholderiales bacterium]
MLSPLALTGRTRDHVVALDAPKTVMHADTVPAYLAMRAAAARSGIDLVPASAFRDFDSQLALWNAKFRGERPLLDAAGAVVPRTGLDDETVIDLILRWSAVPGASRHHWGSDLDLVDAAAIGPGYRVQLVPAEYSERGPFGPLAVWLEANAAGFGFFRPYREDLGGVQPEPWHWSHAPVSVPALQAMSPALLAEALAEAPIEGKSCLLDRIGRIYRSHVAAVASAPAATLA